MNRELPNPRFLLALMLLYALSAYPPDTAAHEVPASVVVQLWIKPAGDELTVLVRVPLEAMRDVDIPMRGLGFVDITRADKALRDATEIWVANALHVFENDRKLDAYRIVGTRVSLPSNRAFREFETAVNHIDGDPLPADTRLYVGQALLDAHLVYPIESEGSEFAIRPQFRRLGLDTTTVVHFQPPGGAERVFELADDPGLLQLDPRWQHAFLNFVNRGFEHILEGYDHLLFLFCLIVPFRQLRPLIVIVTSFTVGHSLTLVGSAFGLTPAVPWFPVFIESLIALSIVYMALENIVGTTWNRRWLIALGFGLVHGFGFSFALGESLQFAGRHLLTSLLAFNLGVEFGQLLIVIIAVPLLNLVIRVGLPERMLVIVFSAILAHSGWHWMTDRVGALRAYTFDWPVVDAAFLALCLRWIMLLVITGLLLWLLRGLYSRLMSGAPASAR